VGFALESVLSFMVWAGFSVLAYPLHGLFEVGCASCFFRFSHLDGCYCYGVG